MINQFKNQFSDLPVLVVGQGLAGTVVAFRLLSLGRKVKVIDNNHQNASTLVAAGLFNPLVFKWITKSWNARTLLKEALLTYRELELYLNNSFVHDDPLVRIIASQAELSQWQRRENQEDFEGLICENDGELAARWDKGFGNRGIVGSGWLDLKKLLSDFRLKLKQENLLIEAKLDYTKLSTEPQPNYNGECYSHVICCEGVAASNNPYFKEVSYRNTKGEVLEVEMPELNLNRMINHGQFIIPLGQNLYRIGTNFDWNDLQPTPTEAAKNAILRECVDFFQLPAAVKSHRAGIRPTSPDRKPLVGRSKLNSNVCLFNGLGSKGALLAPWCAKQLINHLFSDAELHPDIDVNRVVIEP